MDKIELKVFIGSSKGAKSIVNSVAKTLKSLENDKFDIFPILWFEPNAFSGDIFYSNESFKKFVDYVSGVIFVIDNENDNENNNENNNENDKNKRIRYRGEEKNGFENNILMDYALVMGRMSRQRVIFVYSDEPLTLFNSFDVDYLNFNNETFDSKLRIWVATMAFMPNPDHNVYVSRRKKIEEFLDVIREDFSEDHAKKVDNIWMINRTNASFFVPWLVNWYNDYNDDKLRFMRFMYFALKDEVKKGKITTVTNAPTREAIDNLHKHNTAVTIYTNIAVQSSYFRIQELIKAQEPYADAYTEVIKKAYNGKVFVPKLTKYVLPYSLFQIKYKKNFSYMDHIKVDFFSNKDFDLDAEGLSLVVFKSRNKEQVTNDNKEQSLYDFFEHVIINLSADSKDENEKTFSFEKYKVDEEYKNELDNDKKTYETEKQALFFNSELAEELKKQLNKKEPE